MHLLLWLSQRLPKARQHCGMSWLCAQWLLSCHPASHNIHLLQFWPWHASVWQGFSDLPQRPLASCAAILISSNQSGGKPLIDFTCELNMQHKGCVMKAGCLSLSPCPLQWNVNGSVSEGQKTLASFLLPSLSGVSAPLSFSFPNIFSASLMSVKESEFFSLC